MPSRILREGILSSERVCSLSWPEEVFYRRLHSVVDDFGRYFANASLLRAACYPLQLDVVGNPDVAKWIAACARAGLVRTYTVGGKEYLEVLDFRQQKRARESKFPAPPATAQRVLSTCAAPVHLDGVVFEDGGEVEDEGGKKPRARARGCLPEGFAVSERVKAWAAERGFASLDKHLEHFVGWARATGKTYADWDQCFMNAIRDDWAKVRVNGAAVDVSKLQRELEEEERKRAAH